MSVVVPIQKIKSRNFYKFIEKKKFILLDFYGRGCYACKIQAETFKTQGDRLLKKYPTLQIGKFNISHDRSGIASKLDIEYIPTLIIVYGNQTRKMPSGYQSIDEIIEFIDNFIEDVKTGKNPEKNIKF